MQSFCIKALTVREEETVEKIRQILENHYADPYFSMTRFADSMHMSRMHLHRKLKEIYGCSASQLLRKYRLFKAAQYLKERKQTDILQVCVDVGFNHASYFAQCFRNTFGQSPSEFARAA